MAARFRLSSQLIGCRGLLGGRSKADRSASNPHVHGRAARRRVKRDPHNSTIWSTLFTNDLIFLSRVECANVSELKRISRKNREEPRVRPHSFKPDCSSLLYRRQFAGQLAAVECPWQFLL